MNSVGVGFQTNVIDLSELETNRGTLGSPQEGKN